jgi:hypothetical protein
MKRCRPGWVAALILALTVFQLRQQGRVWWCACGRWNVWAPDIWSAHNSQHVLDPYSFTHVLHGVVFFWLVSWLFRRMAFRWQLTLAILLESTWEVAENAPFIIQRYREATIGLGYEGDSVVNSVADILCCAAGFALARQIGFRLALAMFVIVEVLLAILVRDNLSLNVLMLLHPIDAIKQWQMVH